MSFRRARISGAAALDGESGRGPSLEPAREWPHARVADFHEALRRDRGGSLVGTAAVEDDLELGGKLAAPPVELREVDGERSGDVAPVGLAVDRGAHVDHDGPRALVHEAAQLLGGDAREA